jgi:hypothetical protein
MNEKKLETDHSGFLQFPQKKGKEEKFYQRNPQNSLGETLH